MSWFHWVETVTVERNTVSKKEPPKSELEQAAEREAKRGALIGRLAEEAAMWRTFSRGCAEGVWMYTGGLGFSEGPRLNTRMDEITAPAWRDFAERMANQAETRLREILK